MSSNARAPTTESRLQSSGFSLKSLRPLESKQLLTSKLKGLVSLDKTTSRDTAFDSYHVLVAAEPIKEPLQTLKSSEFKDIGVQKRLPSRIEKSQHALDFSKQSERFKTPRRGNASVKPLSYYTPNYDAIKRVTTGTPAFAKITGRQKNPIKSRFAAKVELSSTMNDLLCRSGKIKPSASLSSFRIHRHE